VATSKRRAAADVYAKIYRDASSNISDTVLIAGSGRSGTTWLAEMVSEQLDARLLFEPFNTRLVPEYSEFNYFQYMRPEERDDALEQFVTRLFEGKIRNAWIDRRVSRVVSKRRVAKTIRANLFLGWLHMKFPQVPQMLIIRHPCAVVASRIKQEWATDGDLQPMLSQKGLVRDYLADKMDIIRRASTPEEKHAIVWCIHNIVPLRQAGATNLPVVFYENLSLNPIDELARIFALANLPLDREKVKSTQRPSGTSTKSSAIRTGEDVVSAWRNRITSAQTKRILSVVEAFGLDYLYGDTDTPIGNAE
jgi:hypothetical protein